MIGVTVVALKLLKMISAGLSDVNLALVLDIDAFLLLTVSSLWGVFVELVFFNGWQRSNIQLILSALSIPHLRMCGDLWLSIHLSR